MGEPGDGKQKTLDERKNLIREPRIASPAPRTPSREPRIPMSAVRERASSPELRAPKKDRRRGIAPAAVYRKYGGG